MYLAGRIRHDWPNSSSYWGCRFFEV